MLQSRMNAPLSLRWRLAVLRRESASPGPVKRQEVAGGDCKVKLLSEVQVGDIAFDYLRSFPGRKGLAA